MGEFEQLLLLAVLRLDNDAYGTAIRTELRRRARRDASPGAIYTALERLESRGLIDSWLGEPTPARGGKRKKHYRVTRAGCAAIARAHAAWSRMVEGLAIGGS